MSDDHKCQKFIFMKKLQNLIIFSKRLHEEAKREATPEGGNVEF